MTCGFFILSVPCLSKLIMESGLPRRVKSSLGFAPKSSGPSYEDSERTPHRSGNSGRLGLRPVKPRVNTHTTWSRIEEGGSDVDLGKSESQTNLHGGGNRGLDPKKSVRVSHTVEVSVSNHLDSRDGSEQGSGGPRW
jgi:hypothetical protein